MSEGRFLLVSALLVAASGAPATAQLSGSVYTTNQSASVVNGNNYGNKAHVYLNGGPGPGSPCGGGGLPNGDYYFQVTNPSGSTLLSSDAITNRVVVVSGGKIVAHTGSHTVKNGACPGSKIVQLQPFADSPNSGGEYKVWVTPVASYAPGSGFFGFLPSLSKTDNFKVKLGGGPLLAQSVIRGHKFYDFNANGDWDLSVSQEVPVSGWLVEIYKNEILDGSTHTDDAGRYTFIRTLDGSTYVLVEVAPPPGLIPAPGATWLATGPTQGSVVANAPEVAGPEFGNLKFELALGVGRSKGFWHNQGEPLLAECDPSWREALNGPVDNPLCLRTNVSTADPSLSIFTVLPPPVSFASAFGDWSNYVVGNPALGHAGFILSTQVGAAVLNNTCGLMQGIVYVDRHMDGVLVSLEAMFQGVRVLLCNPGAGLTGPNDPFQDLRNQMLACTNEFTVINNSGDLSAPQPVYTPRADPGLIEY